MCRLPSGVPSFPMASSVSTQPTAMNRPSAPAAPKKSNAKWYILLGIVLLGALGAGAYFKSKNTDKATVVTTDKAVTKTITQMVNATGKIQPEVEVKISPEVAGEIVELTVREGAAVKKGQLLVRIKPDTYKYQVEQQEANLVAAKASSVQANAQLLKAKDDFKRAEDLFGKKLISDSDHLAAKTQVEVAEANYENSLAQILRTDGLLSQSRDQLSKTTIAAPMDGTVSSLSSEVGERVVGTATMAGTDVMTIADLDEMEARVDIGEVDVVLIKVGQIARLEMDSFRDKKFAGEVTEIANTARSSGAGTQQEATKFEVRIRVKERELFRPGMSVTAEVETRYRTNVLCVPIQSVTTRLPKGAAPPATKDAKDTKDHGAKKKDEPAKPIEVIFQRTGDTVKQVPVKRGISDDSYVEILEGVTEGMEVVSGGYKAINRELEDGKLVKADNEKKQPGEAEKK